MNRTLERFLALKWVRPVFVTPVWFSVQSGHLRSSLMGKAVDRGGKPLPWYTYPAIDFLSNADFHEQSVLEFGAGQSTLWWANRAAHVFSVDDDPWWFQQVQHLTSGLRNVELRLCVDTQAYANAAEGRTFDIVVIDGGERTLAAEAAVKAVNQYGVVILDNSDYAWGPPGTWPIIDLFQQSGFMRVDFYGHAPGVVRPHCTSMFFKDSAFILRSGRPPRRRT